MSRLDDLEARMRAVDTKLGELETGLRQDVTTLKAVIEALKAQVADPAVIANMEALATSIEGRLASLTALDQETPPPAPPA